MPGAATHPLHASAVLVGAAAVLIRGAAGSGKSTLALNLLRAPAPFHFALLVGDDRITLAVHGRHLIATAPAPLQGLIELRGSGIMTMPFESRAAIALVVDILDTPPARLPDDDQFSTRILDVALPRLPLKRFATDGADKVKHALRIIYRGEPLAPAFCNEVCRAGA